MAHDDDDDDDILGDEDYDAEAAAKAHMPNLRTSDVQEDTSSSRVVASPKAADESSDAAELMARVHSLLDDIPKVSQPATARVLAPGGLREGYDPSDDLE